jgi:hypothetical protein
VPRLAKEVLRFSHSPESAQIDFGMVEENAGNNALHLRRIYKGETIHIPQGVHTSTIAFDSADAPCCVLHPLPGQRSSLVYAGCGVRLSASLQPKHARCRRHFGALLHFVSCALRVSMKAVRLLDTKALLKR